MKQLNMALVVVAASILQEKDAVRTAIFAV